MKTCFARRNEKSRSGFSLVEILVVLGIIALLGAILFPAFARARENARQTNCASNLNQIYFAVQQYFQDERAYPDSLVDLLPAGSPFNNNGTLGQIPDSAAGYMKSDKVLLCPNDDTDTTLPHSSYGALSKVISTPFPVTPTTTQPSDYLWNFWGYDENGFAYPSASVANSLIPAGSSVLVAPKDNLGVNQGLLHESLGNDVDDRDQNVVKFSLSNRYAPPQTIITHCIFHRIQTANDLNSPQDLTDGAMTEGKKLARDIVLRLDGSARVLDVSLWKQNDVWRQHDKTLP